MVEVEIEPCEMSETNFSGEVESFDICPDLSVYFTGEIMR